jgi:hypothetical protein
VIFKNGARLGSEAARRLAAATPHRSRCAIEPVLTDDEFGRIEREFGFEFADDHRMFLAAGLPVSVPSVDPPGVISTWREPWPDWRDGDREALRDRLDRPVQGVLFDVEHNGFWHESWGSRPDLRSEALVRAQAALADVPRLVPVYGHRFLPSGRGSFGQPVLSVWQTDIIYYGLDLADWVHREFGGSVESGDDAAHPLATVPFWRDLL